jgi:hypothetical protein
MGILKIFGFRSGQDPAAVKQPSDQGADLVKLTDDDLTQFLASCIREASEIAGTPCDLEPKHMGASHASSQYKKGRYVFIQNFDDLGLTKTIQDDRFVRFNFRAVELREKPSQIWLETLVWHPSHGNASEMKLVLQVEAPTGRQQFVQLMATALNLFLNRPSN